MLGTATAAPANDNFADAIVIPPELTNPLAIPGTDGRFEGDNQFATSEPGEPRHTWRGDGKSIWWQWTAPASGELGFDLQHSYAPAVAVYRGDSWATLELVGSNLGDGFLVPQSMFSIPGIRQGTTYRIAFDGWAGSAGSFRFGLSMFPSPANDDLADAIPIEGLPTQTGFMFHARATREPGEPRHPGAPLAATLWWRWTSPFTGKIAVRNQGASYPLVAFYTGTTVSNLVLVSGGILPIQNLWSVPLQAGTTYHIAASAAGNLNLLLSEANPLPSNDLFADAIPIEGTNAIAEGNNTFADREWGEAAPGTNSSGKTLWWKWTAPATGELQLLPGYDFTDTRVEASIYTGSVFSNLTLIGHTTNLQWYAKYYRVERGTTYYFALDTVDGAFGQFRWRFELKATPTNDLFTGRQPLPPAGTSFSVPLGTASREAQEPSLARGKSIGKTLWWTFTPPLDGTIRLSATAEGAYVDVALGVFTDSQLSTLKRRVEGKRELTMRVQRGVPYQIVADPVDWSHWFWGGYVHGLSLTFQYDPVPPNDSFAARLPLVGTSFTVTNRNASGTKERGEPRHASGRALGASIWYTWTAPADGWVYLSARGESFTPIVAVYEGTKLGALRRLAAGGAGYYYRSVAGFAATAGRTYQIAVDSLAEEGLTGNIELSLDFSTLRLTSPTEGAAYASTASVPLAVNEPRADIDGKISGIGYLLTHEWFGAQPVVASSIPPYAVGASNLPPGLYVALAFETNVAGQVHASPPVRFSLRPPGDAFEGRTRLTGYQWHVEGDLAGATLESGEPRHAGGVSSGSIWYSWTAPVSGPVEFSAVLPEHVHLTAYQGTELKRLKRIVLYNPKPWTRGFNAVAGTSYFFVITRSVKAQFDYAGHYRIDLASHSLRLTGPSEGAAYSNDDPIALSISATVAPDRVVSVDYLNGDVVIASGAPGTFSAIWGNVRPGGYSIRARARLASGLVVWSEPVSITVAIANNDFAKRKLLQGANVKTNATLYGATIEPGDPWQGGPQTLTRSAWWSWTAQEDTRVWVDFVSNPGLATVTIWTGQALNALTAVPIRYRATIAGVEFAARAGVTYQIFVGHARETDGFLQVRSVRPPENDLFAGRVHVEGTNVVLSGHNLEAARQAGEPLIPFGCGYPGRMVWWSWTAPGDGYTTIVDLPTHGGPCFRIRAYVGDTLESLVPVSSEDSHDSAEFNVVGGQVYQIAVDTSVEVEQISLALKFQPSPAIGSPQPAPIGLALVPAPAGSALASEVAPASVTALDLRIVGKTEFEVVGVPGQRFRIETSSDLFRWTFLLDGRIAGEPFRFTDPERGGSSGRFFRAVSTP